MLQTASHFIEDEDQDTQCLTETGLRTCLSSQQCARTADHLKLLQSKLFQQQERLHAQHQALLAVQERLKRQDRMMWESFQYLAHEPLPDS